MALAEARRVLFAYLVPVAHSGDGVDLLLVIVVRSIFSSSYFLSFPPYPVEQEDVCMHFRIPMITSPNSIQRGSICINC